MSVITRSGVAKRSISIAGHRTSVSLEEPFWEQLRILAEERGLSVQRLVGEIDAARGQSADPPNLSSALRVFVLEAVLARAGRPGDMQG
jgi:predicted DNA-binding ribbon-helix-helix protein